ncbi:hypothetical protein D3C73_1127090 [compost metagenome]
MGIRGERDMQADDIRHPKQLFKLHIAGAENGFFVRGKLVVAVIHDFSTHCLGADRRLPAHMPHTDNPVYLAAHFVRIRPQLPRLPFSAFGRRVCIR